MLILKRLLGRDFHFGNAFWDSSSLCHLWWNRYCFRVFPGCCACEDFCVVQNPVRYEKKPMLGLCKVGPFARPNEAPPAC